MSLQRNYYVSVEDHFRIVARRTATWVARSSDFQQIDSWHECGIPLDVVLRGISNACRDAKGIVSSVKYCDYAVMGLCSRLQAGTVACACGERYEPGRAGWNSSRNVKVCAKCAGWQEARDIPMFTCSVCSGEFESGKMKDIGRPVPWDDRERQPLCLECAARPGRTEI